MAICGPGPFFAHSGRVHHVQHEADPLPQRDEADHHGQDRGEHPNNLVQDALEHITRDNGAELGRDIRSILLDPSFLQ